MTPEQIAAAVDGARARTHPFRAMCVTLECGHLRLIPYVNTVMGVGAYTACRICVVPGNENAMRQVMKVEETGVLHEDWIRSQTEEQNGANQP